VRCYVRVKASKISSGSGCRPSCFFENNVRSPAVTSNTPPDDGINRTAEMSGNLLLRISSATRTALWRYPHDVQYSMAISILALIAASSHLHGPSSDRGIFAMDHSHSSTVA